MNFELYDMTQEELSKIPFRCVCHMALKDEHIATYSDESGRLGFSVVTTQKDELIVVHCGAGEQMMTQAEYERMKKKEL